MKKVVLVLAILSFTGPAFAKNGEKFNQRKARITSHLDKRVAQLNKHKSCVNSASDREAMKACRASHKESMKSLNSERKAAVEKFKAMRKNKKSS